MVRERRCAGGMCLVFAWLRFSFCLRVILPCARNSLRFIAVCCRSRLGVCLGFFCTSSVHCWASICVILLLFDDRDQLGDHGTLYDHLLHGWILIGQRSGVKYSCVRFFPRNTIRIFMSIYLYIQCGINRVDSYRYRLVILKQNSPAACVIS